MTPLEAGPKLAGFLFALVKWREARRDKRFKLVVQPVFETLQEVHQDSLLMLKSARDTLAKTRSFGETFEEFESKRYEHQGMRHELIRRCSGLLADEKLKDCHAFLRSVDRYFGVGPTNARRLSQRTEIRLVRHAADEDPNVVRAVAELDNEIKQLQEAWMQIGDSYAAALAANL